MSWSGSGSRFIDFGGGSSTLGFGAGSPGGAGLVRVRNWTETNDHLLFDDNVQGQAWVNKLTFDGYNWNRARRSSPTARASRCSRPVGTFAQPDTYYWTGLANSSSGLPVANVWELPGNWDINRYADGVGVKYVFDGRYATAAPVLPGVVTTGGISLQPRNRDGSDRYLRRLVHSRQRHGRSGGDAGEIPLRLRPAFSRRFRSRAT